MKARIDDTDGIRLRVLKGLASLVDDVSTLVTLALALGLMWAGSYWLTQTDADPADIAKASPCVRERVAKTGEVVSRGKLAELKARCAQQEAAVGAVVEPRP
jgi:hypothetical protein